MMCICTHREHIAIHVHWLSQYLNAHIITHVEMMMIYNVEDLPTKGQGSQGKQLCYTQLYS